MISAGNKNMQEAGEILFTLNGDDRIRAQCEAREDYRRTWDGVKQNLDELQRKVIELKTSNKEKETAITKLKSSNDKKDLLIASLEAQIAELQRLLQHPADMT